MSFSLYLVHVPVMLALGHALGESVPPAGLAALGVVLSLPAAAFYRGVEWPSLLLSRRVGRGARLRGLEGGVAGVVSSR